jgi:ABC-2 type transport system ATP-binding protein
MKKVKISIDIRALTKKYKNTLALDNLSFQVEQGEIFGFLGHNGAGKTTAISILTTLLEPTSGNATICGFDTVKESMAVKKCIGYLPENVRFYDNLTASENLEYFAKLSGIKNPKEKISEVLEFIDFVGIENKKLGEFSKGMRQRIGIAQAIIHEPQVLFLDEPTSGLDPLGVRNLREIILKLSKEKKMIIFMNTHLLSEVAKTCTTIGVLNHGKLIQKDSLENILKKFSGDNSLEDIYFTMGDQTK